MLVMTLAVFLLMWLPVKLCHYYYCVDKLECGCFRIGMKALEAVYREHLLGEGKEQAVHSLGNPRLPPPPGKLGTLVLQ